MPTVPATAKKPTDHKKPAEPTDRAPASAYADDIDVVVEYDGVSYTTHPVRVVTDIDAFEAFSSVQAAGGVQQDDPVQAMQYARHMVTVGGALLGADYDRGSPPRARGRPSPRN